jgi:hypothetical protein
MKAAGKLWNLLIFDLIWVFHFTQYIGLHKISETRVLKLKETSVWGRLWGFRGPFLLRLHSEAIVKPFKLTSKEAKFGQNLMRRMSRLNSFYERALASIFNWTCCCSNTSSWQYNRWKIGRDPHIPSTFDCKVVSILGICFTGLLISRSSTVPAA